MISNGWLYLIPTLIWGSTWIVILGQFGVVAPEVTVLYRFVLASIAAFLYCWFKKIPLGFEKKAHFWFAIQGLCNFSINYILTYYAETQLTTGVVAVAFSSLPYMNAVGMFVLYRKKIDLHTLVAMLLGGIGLIMIFHQEISMDAKSVQGILSALAGTFFASLGNLTSVHNINKQRPVFASVTWAMLYGALFTFIYCVLYQKSFVWDSRPTFLASLFYLSIAGTTIAFGVYFSLIKKVGAAKAAYTSIMIPIIALILSYFFENFHWNYQVTIGLSLAVLGQILILRKRPVRQHKN